VGFGFVHSPRPPHNTHARTQSIPTTTPPHTPHSAHTVRKLFEPALYPRAQVRSVFDQAFGADRLSRHPHELCAVGFEPNPTHAPALTALQEAYKEHGWRVHFFTGVAVSTIDGEAHFHLDGEAPARYRQPGSSLLSWAPQHERVRVRTVDLARYLLEEVGQRRFEGDGEGARHPPPAVLMKVDVEGLEHGLLPHLIATGALCRTPIDQVFLEWHLLGGEWRSSDGMDATQFVHFFGEFIEGQRANGTAAATACPVRIVEMDDEMYDTSDFPLPSSPPLPPLEEEEEDGAAIENK
jgi:hypothetical protein